MVSRQRLVAPPDWYYFDMERRFEPTYADLPGGDLLATGLEDLRQGRKESVPALLAQIGAPRLRQLAIDVPVRDPDEELPEHRLYKLLAREHGNNAHSRYNALIRLLVSFTRAVACARYGVRWASY